MYIFFISIAIVLTYYFVRRFRSKSGILVYRTVFSTVFIITLAGILLPISVFKYAKELYQSETYNAKIVDFAYETRKNDSDEGYYEITVKLPIVQFITAQGDTITKKTAHYNTLYSYKEKTMNCKVHYNLHTGNVFMVGRDFYTMLSVMIFFALFFDFLLVGIVLYILNKDMSGYKRMISIAFFYIIIPMIILIFATLLLLAAYEEPDLSLAAKIACVFFGVLLLFVLIGYIKSVSKNKNKKSHNNSHHSRSRFLEFRR